MKVSWFAAAALLFQTVSSPIRTATVDGTVLDAGSGEPVSGARVQLFRAASVGVGSNLKGQTLSLEDLQPYSATTEQDGRFRFANVQPGEYRLLALREGGYVPGEYGQRSATGYGTSFVLTPGQDMSRVRLVVTPTGAIAGRVYDRDGSVGRWQVQALRPIYRDGQRTLTIVQAVQTDDRGEYRLFWLPPGSYYVMARPFTDHNPTPVGADRPLVNPVQIREPIRGGSIEQASPPVVRSRTLPDGDVVDEVQLPIYYPGTTDERAASKIDLRAGANAEGFDLAVTTGVQRARRIRGVVVANGLPVAAAEVLGIAQHSSASLAVPSGQSAGDGSFEITGSVPGSYLVFARTNAGATGAVAVEVGDSDVDQVVIPIVADIRLTGTFIIEGQSRNGRESGSL
jgi:hypothetical protein